MTDRRIDRIIEQISRAHRIPVSRIRGDTMQAIHAGFTSDDPDARERFQMLFGDQEPTLKAFIAKIAESLDPPSGLY